MTVDEAKKFCEYISNKDQSGNSMSPDEYNTLLRTSAIDFARHLYGTTEDYRPGDPTPPVVYEVTQYVTDALRVLKIKDDSLLLDTNGKANIPPDYAHVSSIRYNYVKKAKCPDDAPVTREVPVEVVKDNKLGMRLKSSIEEPSLKYPICVFYNNYMQFYPKTLGSVIFTYLKEPLVPVWGYTMVNDQPVYDPETSVQFEYPDIFHLELCRIILNYMGINLRDNELQSHNERFKQRGL